MLAKRSSARSPPRWRAPSAEATRWAASAARSSPSCSRWSNAPRRWPSANASRPRFGLAIDDCQGGTVTGLGVSIGVAIWPEIDEDTLEGVLAAADSALYEAKRLGRDQVQLAGAHRRLRWSPSARTSHAADQRPPRRLDPARGHA